MKIRVLLFCITVLAICVWLLLHRPMQQERTIPRDHASQTNQQTPSHASQPLSLQKQGIASNSVNTNGAFTKNPPWPTAQAFSKQALAAWHTPIAFYGKVIDQNSNPIEGASVQFQWSGQPDKMSKAATASDAKGLFSLEGKEGRILDVSVSKDGYYNSRRDKTGFLYALGPDIYSPDPSNPVIFHLHKKGKGQPLIEQQFPPGIGQIWQLHHDGKPISLDLLNGSQNTSGSGQMKLEFWRDISDLHKQPFDWKLQLSVAGGGILQTDEEFPFEAPENGYQHSVVIDMPATNQNWIGDLRTKFYLQMPNGNYGRIDFYILPYNGVFTVKSWVNPTGSRNLEPQ